MHQCFALLGLATLLTAAAGASDAPCRGPGDRPSVGLVLSGGGARGAAHVGVLQVLDELRVPVDCVAGTSMGSVVGGLFASGWSPDELEALLGELDWQDIFDDRPPRQQIPYRRKQDDGDYLDRFEVGLEGGRPVLPSGLVRGQKLDWLLERLTAHVAGVDDFHRLPLPFVTVATDVSAGAEVVIESGDLSRALRASMSVPGIFSPVAIDGRLLLDGGLVNNLPVDHAHRLGADVVIAVSVGDSGVDTERLRSLSGALSEVIGMVIRKNVAAQMEAADLTIQPDTGPLTSSSFDDALAMVPRGAAAARRVADEFRRLSVDEAAWQRWLDGQRRRLGVGGRVASVGFEGARPSDVASLTRRVELRPGDPLDLGRIRRDLLEVYGLGVYEIVTARLEPLDGDHGDPDRYDVTFEAEEKSWGTDSIRLGVDIASDLEGEGSFNVQALYTRLQLNRLRGELKIEGRLGNDPRVFVELYQPLEPTGTLFVAPWLSNDRFTTLDLDDSGRFGELKIRSFRTGVDLGVSFQRFGELRLGAESGSSRIEAGRGASEIDKGRIDHGGWSLNLALDQLDTPHFPRHGWWGSLTGFRSSTSLGADEEYRWLRSVGGGAFTVGRVSTVAWTDLVSSLDSRLPPFQRFQLGGLFELSGYPPGQITGQDGGHATAAVFYDLLEDTSLFGELYAGGSIEMGNLWESRNAVDLGDLRWGTSVFLGADTILGPVYVAYGRNDAGTDAWYLYVGRFF